jgi:formylglycine-generating enzyme required for sulfatase activity
MKPTGRTARRALPLLLAAIGACGDGPGAAPGPGELVFTEVMVGRLTGHAWVEVANRTSRRLDLQGCTLEVGATSTRVEGRVPIRADGLAVLARKGTSPEGGAAWAWGDALPAADGDRLALTCAAGRVDAFAWDRDLLHRSPAEGCSLSLCLEDTDPEANDDLRHWRPNGWDGSGDCATPGVVNPSCGGGGDPDALPDAGPDAAGDTPGDGGFEAASTPAPDLGLVVVDPSACEVPAVPEAPDCGHPVPLPGGGETEACLVVPPGRCHVSWIGEDGRIDPEITADQPRLRVRLTNYAMMRTPVTVQQYRRCLDRGGCRHPDEQGCLWAEDGFDFGRTNLYDDTRLDHPVVCVDRGRAQDFCRWLGGGLPTEAQYEYAATGPLSGPEDYREYPWGNEFRRCAVNIGDDPAHPDALDPFDTTSPVGFFDGSLRTRADGGWAFGPDTYQTCDDQSPFGLRDLTHNVQELVADGPAWYADWPADPVDPRIPSFANSLNVRGSGWIYREWWHSRVFTRFGVCSNHVANCPGPIAVPDELSGIAIGFRCAFGAPSGG